MAHEAPGTAKAAFFILTTDYRQRQAQRAFHDAEHQVFSE
jgi:hypothetical protein